MNGVCRRGPGETGRALITLSVSLLSACVDRAAAQDRPQYALDLHFEPADAVLMGKATVTAGPPQRSRGEIVFSAAVSGGRTLEILRISRPGEEESVSWSGPDEGGVVRVPVRDGSARVSISLEYRLTVDSATFRPFGYYIFEGISGWPHPRLLDEEGRSPFADFEVSLDHPASLTVLTTGGVGEPRRRETRLRAAYRAEHVRGFAIVAGEGYRIERHDEEGAPVVAFFHPDHEERFRYVIRRAKEAADWYRRTYGFFPLEEIGIIQGHPRWGGGYPLPNMFAVHLGMLQDEFLTWITAHELGHYYWGGMVLAALGELDWLQLALGIWSDQYYLAERRGIPLREQWRRNERQGDWFGDYLSAVVGDREQRLDLGPEEAGRLDFDYNSWVRHGKAATGLYLLSLQLGPDRFLDLQRRILEEHRYRPFSPEELVEMLESLGVSGASGFLDAWRRGDATIGAAVDAVEPVDGGESWAVSLLRTGTVPYPVTVEVETEADRVRHVMPADAQTDTVRVRSRPVSVRLDPDGEIPMWNSSHPGIRAAYLRALESAGAYPAFIPLTKAHLERVPEDDYLRYRLIRRLYWIGRWDEAAALWPADRSSCDARDDCLAAIYAARARVRSGHPEDARALLDAIRPDAARTDAISLWETARRESVP